MGNICSGESASGRVAWAETLGGAFLCVANVQAGSINRASNAVRSGRACVLIVYVRVRKSDIA